MTGWKLLINVSLNTSALTLMILGLILTIIIQTIDKRTKKVFFCIFSIMILFILSTLIWLILGLLPGKIVLHTQLFIFLGFVFSSLLPPMMTIYLLKHCSEEPNKNVLINITKFLWLIFFLILIIAQFTKSIYYITPKNEYYRGPWYALLQLPLILIMLLTFIILINNRNSLSKKQSIAFTFFLITQALSMLIQIVFFGLMFFIGGMTAAAMALFLFILLDQRDKTLFLQKENMRQQASILKLQMRPHFIYNTMISIYYLCQQDVEKAQQVILDFTSYLRQNYSAIAKEELIPFSDELEHTRAYLSVVQVRYEGLLFVNFDIPHKHFLLPALTLQPIVENSVQHGVDPELDPLSISVCTRKTKHGSKIVVEDNGIGYSPVTDNQVHIGLKNVRERLRLMCDATLKISPRSGGGTVVTIEIPDKKQKKNQEKT